jgi:hypothetical protein
MNFQNILLENFGVVTVDIRALVCVQGDKKNHKKIDCIITGWYKPERVQLLTPPLRRGKLKIEDLWIDIKRIL